MSILALLVLIWAITRFGCVRRWHRGDVYAPHSRRLHELRYAPAPRKTETHASAFETLKRKYVSGQLTDDQYETELDALLKTPQGRSELNQVL